LFRYVFSALVTVRELASRVVIYPYKKASAPSIYPLVMTSLEFTPFIIPVILLEPIARFPVRLPPLS